MNFLYLFSLFHFILRNYILAKHSWNVLMILIFIRVQHYVMFNYLTKASVINLKEFIVKRINYLGWEWNLSIRPPRFFKYCLEVSMKKNQRERLSWKTIYFMILTSNNTNGVSSQLFGCDRAKLGPLGRRNLQHQIFITELLLVWLVGYMKPNTTDWATIRSQVPWNGNLPTWIWHLNL